MKENTRLHQMGKNAQRKHKNDHMIKSHVI